MLDYHWETNFIGILVAFVMPLLAIIHPIYHSLRLQLRDSLDVFRQKVDVVTVTMTKIEDELGLSFH